MKKRLYLKTVALATVLLLTGCVGSENADNSENSVTTTPLLLSDTTQITSKSTSKISLPTSTLEENDIENYIMSSIAEQNEIDSETCYFIMGMNLDFEDAFQVYEIEPVLDEESELYIIDNAAIVRKPLDFFVKVDDYGFDKTVYEFEKSLDEWKLVLTGDTLGKMTVSNAVMYFKKYDNEFHLFAEKISLDGNVTLSGLLYCETLIEGKNPSLFEGSLVFYPYPSSLIGKDICVLPVESTIRNNNEYVFAADTISLYLGDINDISIISKDWFKDSNYIDISITLSDIELSFAQAQTGEAKSYAKVIAANLNEEKEQK